MSQETLSPEQFEFAGGDDEAGELFWYEDGASVYEALQIALAREPGESEVPTSEEAPAADNKAEAPKTTLEEAAEPADKYTAPAESMASTRSTSSTTSKRTKTKGGWIHTSDTKSDTKRD